jgi:RNA polymerase subunit RPABC4/transcription elongation factor Spt4
MLWQGSECGRNQGNDDLNGTIIITDCDRSETTGECGVFQLFGYHDNK